MPLPLVAVAVAGSRAGVCREGEAAFELAAGRLPALARELSVERVRWVWWSAERDAAPLLDAGLRLEACWDLAAVHRLIEGGRRDDPAAITAAATGAPPPPPPDAGLTLLARDGSLSEQEQTPVEAASLALRVQQAQAGQLAARPDPRARAAGTRLALLTAYAESAAALLAAELGRGGLPVSEPIARGRLESVIGPPDSAGAARAARDAEVLRHLRGKADLRNPLAVRELLQANGFDVPDTRSWRLEPLAASPGIAALLAWRKAERIATTYGYGWLAENVRGGRLRGQWSASDGAAGRMTATAGLHNLPAELRGCVVAEPGQVLVRADLGQIEPRVLAVVSGDPGLRDAAASADMYAPVAEQLGVDRPTAKVAVLAAMYGQTSGAAGAALARMERAYPVAIAYLQAAEARGRVGLDVETWGGRRVRMGGSSPNLPEDRARGRFARNAVVQGAAAEFFKAWAGTVRAGLSGTSDGAGSPAYRGEIVLCLHDELLLQAPAERAEAATQLLESALASVAGWWAAGSGVRFVAEISAAASWVKGG